MQMDSRAAQATDRISERFRSATFAQNKINEAIKKVLNVILPDRHIRKKIMRSLHLKPELTSCLMRISNSENA